MLILGGVSGAGMLVIVDAYRPILMVVTFSLLGIAFYFTYRPRGSATRRGGIMALNKVMLWFVTAATVFLLFCPQYLTALVSQDGGFTADMNRTVLAIEGMTCPG